jgi:hypothetical protein
MGDDRRLLAVGRQRHGIEAGLVQALLARRRRRTAQGDRGLGGLARGGVQRPDREAALEDYGPAVIADRRPQHPAVGEARDLLGLAADGQPPDVLRAALVAHVIERAAVGPPHRPQVLGAGRQQFRVRRRRRDRFQPQLGFVDVRVAVAPPLTVAQALGHQSHRLAVGRRRALEFGQVALAADLQRRAAGRRDAEDVALPRDVVGARGEIDPLTVTRPAVQGLARLRIGQALQFARGERQHIEVGVAAARGDEGQPAPVWRIGGPRLCGGIGDQQPGLTALGGNRPDVAARNEGDLGAVGRQGGLGQGRQGRHRRLRTAHAQRKRRHCAQQRLETRRHPNAPRET